MNKTINRIKAAASAVVHTAASAVVLCLLAVGLAPQAWAEYCEHCITFSADKPFGIRMVKGKGDAFSPAAPAVTLQYSTNQVNWLAFDPDTDYAAGADHKLYLRGQGNSAFASDYKNLPSANVFTNTVSSQATAIACSGNIETLLDYTKVAAGEHPTMGKLAFCRFFSGFAALTTPPALPAMALSERCYNLMFGYCSSLTKAPALPATTLVKSCYYSMFQRCTSLTVAPELPATTLAENCYSAMFNGCDSLTTPPPALPAMKMAEKCCWIMFGYCPSLTDLPELRATTLAKGCYQSMFVNCSSLKVNTASPGKAWSIPSGTGEAEDWNTKMFEGTSGTLTGGPTIGTTYYVASAPARIAVTDVEGATAAVYTNGTVEVAGPPYVVKWGESVKVVYTATNGFMFAGGYRTFSTNLTASASETTVTLAKDQGPIAAKACTNCLTFAAEDGFGIRMWKNGNPSVNPSLEYSTDKTYWATFDKLTGAAAGPDHKLYLRGTGNKAFASYSTSVRSYTFTNTAESAATAIACSGNIETLLDYKTVAAGNHPVMGQYAFYFLFKGFTALTAAPELPAMTLEQSCYGAMFSGCTSLTAAPELPAMTLEQSCYGSMFKGCTSLTTAPDLPATNLAKGCYLNMFRDCTSLTAAPPALPATNLTENCYNSMFAYCTSLTAALELPAKTLAKSCYAYMFYDCTSLIVNTNAPGKAWSLPAEAAASAESATTWNSMMFEGTPGNITNTTVTCGTPYYVASVPVPIAFSVTAPAGAEAKVYTNAVDAANLVPAGGTVWSYRDAFVVYTVTEPGKFFENGQTAITNRLDTKVVTATDAATPTKIGTPTVMLGVVAQRYPWNGILDVQYKTPYYCGLVTFKANGTVIGTAPGTAGQVATVSIDLNTAAEGAFKGKALKNVKITATIE